MNNARKCLLCNKWFTQSPRKTLCAACAPAAAAVSAANRDRHGAQQPVDGQEERIAVLAERAAAGRPLFDGRRADR